MIDGIDVFRAIEAPVPLAECFADVDNTCPLTECCRLRTALTDEILITVIVVRERYQRTTSVPENVLSSYWEVLKLKAFRTVDGVADTEIFDALAEFPAKSNTDLGEAGAEVPMGATADGTYAVTAIFDLEDPQRLDGDLGAYLRLSVRDDLTGITSFTALIEGTKEHLLS